MAAPPAAAARPGPAAPGRPAATPAAPGAVLVGRDVELRQAIAALDEARGATRVVLVEGEPGIGKTRLMEELAAEAAARGTTVLWGRAYEGGATPAFWPWLPPLRALATTRDESGGLAPELAAVIGSNGEVGGAADRTRFQLFDAVTGLVRAVAADRPLMVVLDDIQWADLASLELLTFVAGQLVDAPLLLACTVRQLEVGRNDAVVEALASLSRAPATRRIVLRGLSHLATAELVGPRRRAAPSTTWSTAAIQDRAEGNPFFATELARLVVAERGRDEALGAVAAGGDVPSGVRDVVRRRIALLPEATVRLLQTAAVVGRDVPLDLMTAAAGADVELDAVLDGIEPAVVHRLLAPVPDQPATFRFSHALVREVLADDVSALRRARIHLTVADALEATAGDLDDTAEILAEHLWAAAPIGAGPRAAAALERAAEVAVRRYAFEAAEDFLTRAVQLRRTSASTAADTEAEMLAINRLLSIQRSVRGYGSIADSPHLRRAKQLAARVDRTDVLARLLWAEWAAHDTVGEFARSGAIADQLRELGSGHDDPLVRVTGLAAQGVAHWHRGEVTEASAPARRGRDGRGVGVDPRADARPRPGGAAAAGAAQPVPPRAHRRARRPGRPERGRGRLRGPGRGRPRPVRHLAGRGVRRRRGRRHRPAGVGGAGRPPGHRGGPGVAVQLLGPGPALLPRRRAHRAGPPRGGRPDDRDGHRAVQRGRRPHRHGRVQGRPGGRTGRGRAARRRGRRGGGGLPRAGDLPRAVRRAGGDRGRRPVPPCPGRRPGRGGATCSRPRWRWRPPRAATRSPAGSSAPPPAWASTSADCLWRDGPVRRERRPRSPRWRPRRRGRRAPASR